MDRKPGIFGIPTLLLLAAAIAVPGSLLIGQQIAAQAVDEGTFELGDGLQPIAPGIAELLGDPGQPGPDWEDLFNADRTLKDEVDASGQPGSNGISDYFDLHGGLYAVFVADQVSAGLLQDTTTLVDGQVQRGQVPASEDIGNAYVYATHNSQGQLLLYAGAERVGTGDGLLQFEFNQSHVRLGHGPPWSITGKKKSGDLNVRMNFAGGVLGSVEIQSWSAADKSYQTILTLPGEGCDDQRTACVICNSFSVDGGAWENYDSSGNPVDTLAPSSFAELGLNVGAILGANVDYTSIQVKTASDVAFAYFAEGN
jgi:hypothetical protein